MYLDKIKRIILCMVLCLVFSPLFLYLIDFLFEDNLNITEIEEKSIEVIANKENNKLDILIIIFILILSFLIFNQFSLIQELPIEQLTNKVITKELINLNNILLEKSINLDSERK